MQPPNSHSEPPISPPSRTIEGRRFVLILLGMAVVVILIAIGTYFLVCYLRHKYGLPIN